MKNGNSDLGYHFVAFLDVQGQRERFRALRLPTNPDETAAVAEVLRQTAGFVLDLRQAFDEQFEPVVRSRNRFEKSVTVMLWRIWR
jgi:hypothetical protein